MRAADDPGANHTPDGAYAYRNAGPDAAATYGNDLCVEVQTPPLTVEAGRVTLQYWERHQIEYRWDGVAVEYSVNGGAWIDVPPPSNDPAVGCAAGDDTSGWEDAELHAVAPHQRLRLSDLDARPDRAAAGGGTTCNNWTTGPGHALRAPVPLHRRLRRRATRSASAGASPRIPGCGCAGFYLDDVAVTNVLLPNACSPDTCGAQPDGSPCEDGNACTAGDVCDDGSCQPGSPGSPPETAGSCWTMPPARR